MFGMRIVNELFDTEYAFHGFTHTREIVRGVILNEKNEVCLEYIYDDDMFGHRDYYETPGGGKKDKETIAQACLREVQEETGYESTILKELGLVVDYYNLIHRKNRNYYFLTKATHYVGKHLDNYEKTMLEKVIWVSIDEAIRLYENMGGSGVAIIVRNRELPILKKVKKLLERGAL